MGVLDRKALAALLPALVLLTASPSAGAPSTLPFDRAAPLTSEPDPVTGYAVSRDGRTLYYLKIKWPFAEIWKKSADPAQPGPPVMVSGGDSDKRSLAVSPDGKKLAYVSTLEDAKGDVWLLELDGKSPPRRLTFSDYADDAPAFSPDGSHVYYHRSPAGENRASLAKARTDGGGAPEEVFGSFDAREPALSPDGWKIAFRSAGPGGREGIFIFDTASKTSFPVVTAQEIGGPPHWGDDDLLYFTRRLKTRENQGNGFKRVAFAARAVEGGDPCPITVPGEDASQPMTGGPRLYYLSKAGGIPNVHFIGRDGFIPGAPDAETQEIRASSLLLTHPPRPDLEYLAYARINWRFPESPQAGPARLQTARALHAAGFVEEALRAYKKVAGDGNLAAEADLEGAALAAIAAKEENQGDAGRRKAAARSLAALKPYESHPDEGIRREALLYEAMIRMDVSGSAEDIGTALKILDQLLVSGNLDSQHEAFALFHYAKTLEAAGLAGEARQRYVLFLDKFPGDRTYSLEASNALIDSATREYTGTGVMEALRKISEDAAHPALAAGALVRIGDLLYAGRETERAKENYRRARELSPDSAQGMNARLALAEILYREERYPEALALFEKEAAGRSIVDQLHYHIRSAYIRKSLAAAERLLKRGELGEAKTIFREIADYDRGNVEALRGLVRAAAVTGETEPLYAEYLALSQKKPNDPKPLYLAGLALSYRETEEAHKKALELVEKAIALNGRPAFFHQTAGYLKEALAAKRGSREGDGGAGESYRMALYLTNREANPDNYAALLMNLGNASHRSAQDGLARKYYRDALDAGIIFDDADQEFAFRLRHAVSSFRAGFDSEAAALFRTALEKAGELAQPSGAVAAFDAFSRHAFDRLVRPAQRSGDKRAGEAAGELSALAGRMAALSREMRGPPPDPSWPRVKDALEKIAADMETAIAGKLAPLAVGPNGMKTLSALKAKAAHYRAAVRRPETYALRMAEIFARMGLALDQAGEWDKAADAYGEALRQNAGLGREAEAGLNLFSRAYALYREAGKLAGPGRADKLKQSRELFRQAAKSAGKNSREAKKDAGGGGLINISAVVTLAGDDATEAARGFSPVQKSRAINAFLGRISTELGEPGEAERILSEEAALYPPGKPVAGKDLLGVSVLLGRQGHLKAAAGKREEAFEAFARSASYASARGSGAASAMAVRNMARVWLGLPAPLRFRLFPQLAGADRAARELLYSASPPSTLDFLAEYENSLGAAYISGAEESSALEEAAVSTAMLALAAEHLEKGLKLIGPDPSDGELLNLSAALNLNRALLSLGAGDGEGVRAYAGKALEHSKASLSENQGRKALLLLGRNREALEWAESSLPFGAAAEPGELTAPLAREAAELAARGNTEEAFALLSRAFEAERYLLLSPYTAPVPRPDASAAIKAAAARISLIGKLAAATATEGLPEVRDALKREKALLEKAAASRPWEPLDLAMDEGERDWAIQMLALALEARDNFDSPEKAAEAKKGYREKFLSRPGGETPAPIGLPALFGPHAPTAGEIMGMLPEDAAYLLAAPLGDGRFVAFTLYPDGMEAQVFENASELKRPDSPRAFATLPDGINLPPDAVRVLDPGHLARALRSEKPFLAKIARAPLPPASPGADVLVVPQPVAKTATLPVREGERPFPLLAFRDAEGKTVALTSLIKPSAAPTAAVFTPEDPETLRLAVMLFAQNGCPTLIAGNPKAAPPPDWPSSQADLTVIPEGFTVYGAGLMEPGRAAAFAERSFADYVGKGRKLFDSGDYAAAVKAFEEAGELMELFPGAKRYEEALLSYAREAAYLAGNIDGAVRHALKLAEKLETEKPDSGEHADSLLKAGLLLARAGRYGEAEALLARSAEMFSLLGEGARYAGALADLGTVLENSGDYDRALENFRSAAGEGAKLSEKALLLRQYSNMGRILDMRLARWPEARKNYEKALALARETGDREAEAQALVDTGRCLRLTGDFDGAAKYFEEAGLIAEVLGNVGKLVASIALEKANTFWYRGDYQRALDLAGEAAAIAARENWELGRALSENTMGLVWWTLGDLKRALSHLEDALAWAKTVPGREDEVASSLNNIGLVYRQTGEYDKAREYFEKALLIDRRMGSLWGIAYDLRNLGLNYILSGNPSEALPLIREAVDLTMRTGNRINEAKARFALGLALERTGDAAGSGEFFAEARALSEEMGLKETAWSALHGLARLALANGDRDRAGEFLEKALAIIESMRAGIKVEELRDGFIADKAAVYEDLIRMKADRGDAAGAFFAAERSRARNFIDLLGNRTIRAGGETETRFLEEARRMRAREEELRSLFANAKSPEEEADYGAALRRLERDREELLYSIRAKKPELASMVSVEPSTEAEVRALLEDSTVMAAYFLLPEEILVFTLTREKLVLTRVPASRETLAADILEFRRRIQNLEPVTALSSSLYDLLVRPVEGEIRGAKRVCVVPHGALHNLSFATLFNGRSYLIDDFPLFNLPGASVLRYTLDRRPEKTSRRVLAVGNPDLGDEALSLPFAEQEVGRIGWNFPEIDVLTGREATKAEVLKRISDYGVIHIAGHGEFDPVNPLLSALMLSPGMEGGGELSAAEIFGLELKADLVLLSACRTGLSRITGGDDLIGMNRSFLYAGTHSVISSLWRVGDVSTAVLVKEFYRQHMEKDKADSLRLAVLHTKSLYPHPGHWGAFTLVGDFK